VENSGRTCKSKFSVSRWFSKSAFFLSGHACGKSSGLSVIYYWLEPGSVILLLLAYPKNEQENLTPAQLKILKSMIETEFP
jgi:hypothetical protein